MRDANTLPHGVAQYPTRSEPRHIGAQTRARALARTRARVCVTNVLARVDTRVLVRAWVRVRECVRVRKRARVV